MLRPQTCAVICETLNPMIERTGADGRHSSAPPGAAGVGSSGVTMDVIATDLP